MRAAVSGYGYPGLQPVEAQLQPNGQKGTSSFENHPSEVPDLSEPACIEPGRALHSARIRNNMLAIRCHGRILT
jgi:hypothetical protein